MGGLAELLGAYGFDSKAQIDIVRLLYLAGCFDNETLIRDLPETGFLPAEIQFALKIASRATHNSHPKDLPNFNAQLILDRLFFTHYPTANQSNWPGKIHNWLIKVTQLYFYARTPEQERWQQAVSPWMQQYEPQIRQICTRLELEAEVSPTQDKYVATVVFGATANKMQYHLHYLHQMTTEIKTYHIYLLCGERYVTPEKDGGASYIEKIARFNNIKPEQVTEMHLMTYAHQRINGEGKIASIPLTIVGTPKGTKQRPTTIDTLRTLSTTTPDLAGPVLFISSAPNIHAQKEDTVATLNHCLPHVQPEVVGPKCENVPINRTLGALGGALYGGYERVALAMGCSNSSEQLNDSRVKFSYATQICAIEPISFAFSSIDRSAASSR